MRAPDVSANNPEDTYHLTGFGCAIVSKSNHFTDSVNVRFGSATDGQARLFSTLYRPVETAANNGQSAQTKTAPEGAAFD